MADKEAKARIKINKMLEEAGWRLLDSQSGRANVLLENNVKITEKLADDFGNDFEKVSKGYVDFLLLDEKGFPLVVLEAKSEEKDPLVGKEQARRYTRDNNCRYAILSNGNIHYFWDIMKGNPEIIVKFPEQASIQSYKSYKPNPEKLANEKPADDYITLTQYPNYANNASYKDSGLRKKFIEDNKLKFLRKYQLDAINALQQEVRQGKERFLFEMATGTGKTLVSAAVIKLFLRTGNARRVLFLVDRLELETQADKRFKEWLKNDYTSVIYKENRDDWRKAEIVVTTVQSLLFNNKYRQIFSPTDFDLVISDEAHRSIGGNARAVFEYFVGYKLGLTATPKDYLKRYDFTKTTKSDPREYERRLLLDTYRTFGCESGQPTFRYSLTDGVKDDFLINPIVVDARTDVTTELLSEQGYSAIVINDDGDEEEQSFLRKDFEKRFFSDQTNMVLCKTFLENSLHDPVSGEFGKSLVFTVSQKHAAKITQILNVMADKMYPDKYNSDFAVQVTSHVKDAQKFTINFANNNLNGKGNFIANYKTCKTRVCVTVGMMTTGYDCTDLLNIALMRPVFSPTDFVQMKGRGTRKHNFTELLFDEDKKAELTEPFKKQYKLFDFFATCEYFEKDYNYDEVKKLPPIEGDGEGGGEGPEPTTYINLDPDYLAKMTEQQIGIEGMKIDRMFFEKFEDKIKSDVFVKASIEQGHIDEAVEHIKNDILNKPLENYTIDKLRRAAGVDRRITLREIVEKIFGFIPMFKSREELLDEEFDKFVADYKPAASDNIAAIKYFFKAYITDGNVRNIIDSKSYVQLNVNSVFTVDDFKQVPVKWREIVPEYVKDYVVLNRFIA